LTKMIRRLTLDEYHRPTFCKLCEGVMIYKGIGEYQCEECGEFAYDDYGKVRNYLEKHKGANVAEISEITGVSHKSIREMIKDNRFEVIDNRGGYIRCERCGANINSGRYCKECEVEYHRQIESEARLRRTSSLGVGKAGGTTGEEGSKRFTRER